MSRHDAIRACCKAEFGWTDADFDTAFKHYQQIESCALAISRIESGNVIKPEWYKQLAR